MKTLVYLLSKSTDWLEIEVSQLHINFWLSFLPQMYLHLLLSNLLIHLDRRWGGQETMAASWYEKSLQLTRFNRNSPQSKRDKLFHNFEFVNVQSLNDLRHYRKTLPKKWRKSSRHKSARLYRKWTEHRN